MGKPRFTEEFKIDAIKQITERGYRKVARCALPSNAELAASVANYSGFHGKALIVVSCQNCPASQRPKERSIQYRYCSITI